MPWGALIVGGLSLAGSIIGGKKAEKGMDQQAAAMREQVQLGREQLDFGKHMYSDWKGRFDPMYASLLAEMDQDLTPNYGMIAGDVSSAFQSARDQELRNMRRYGIKPTEGAYRNMNRQYGIDEAAAHVGARSQARESKRGLKYSRMADVTNMLVGLQGQPANMINSGYSNAMTAQGNMANMWGQQSMLNYGRTMNDAYGLGQLAGGVDWGGIWGDVKGWFGGNSGGGSSGVPFGK